MFSRSMNPRIIVMAATAMALLVAVIAFVLQGPGATAPTHIAAQDVAEVGGNKASVTHVRTSSDEQREVRQ